MDLKKEDSVAWAILLAVLVTIAVSPASPNEDAAIASKQTIPEDEIMHIILSDARVNVILSGENEKNISFIDDDVRESLSRESAIGEDLPDTGTLYHVEFPYGHSSVVAIVDLDSQTVIRLFMKASVGM